MDLDPAAVQSAAKAIRDWLAAFPAGKDSGYMGWGATTEELALATLTAAAPLIASATADAIADKIKVELASTRHVWANHEGWAAFSSTYDRAEDIARAYGRTPDGH